MAGRVFRYFVYVMLAQVLLMGSESVVSQDTQIILSLAVPGHTRNLFATQLLREFEETHPNITVAVVTSEGPYLPVARFPQFYLDTAKGYVESADVLYATPWIVSPEGTRAGYFLDLAPLVRADESLGVNDFWPSVWQSYQWDGGTWALPAATDILGLVYDPAAFDVAGLAYPSGRWEMSDLTNAARSLAQRDSDGRVLVPGLADPSENFGVLFHGLLNHGVFDPTTVPNTADFGDPNLEMLVASWSELINEGVIDSAVTTAYTLDDIPMVIQGISRVFFPAQNSYLRRIALLPGNVAGLNVSAFAVSSGTSYPEEAYELAKFLTTHPDVSRLFGIIPVRQSLVGSGSDRSFAMPDISDSPEFDNILEIVRVNALPVSETRFMGYLALAFDQLEDQPGDVASSIQYAESQALAALTRAESNRASPVVVATPVPIPDIAADQIALSFGVITGSGALEYQDELDHLIDQFVEDDPQVGHIEVEYGLPTDEMLANDFDCFYATSNLVGSRFQSRVLPLDPLMSADPAFDEADFLEGVLSQVKATNQTWALPIVLFPHVLWYDAHKTSAYGLSPPETGWDIQTFQAVLETLGNDDSVDPAFFPRDYSGVYLRMLIAAYGSVPLDFRTTPPTIDFTSDATIVATRQVLDLARQGYIQYHPLAAFGAVPNMGYPAIFDDMFSTFSVAFLWRLPEEGYKLTVFPHGSQYTPVSFDTMGITYIGLNSINPEACYRFMRVIAGQPWLFQGMPVRRSHFDDPALAAAQSADILDFYRNYDAVLQSPNAILLTPSTTLSGFYLQYWLNGAFDQYVLEDADLEVVLADAEVLATTFLECIGLEATTDQIRACAATIDPSVPW